MKFKICGMKYPDNIMEVAKLNPDFMGFIFYPQSKRFVGKDFTLPKISSFIKKTGVFVNDSIENILENVQKHNLDFVQLHGDESADFCSKLLQNLKLLKKSNSSPHTGIIKAFGVDEHFNFSTLSEYENCCEYFMFDTKVKNYGGSGKSFDRGILKNYKLAKPFFISGGIDLNELRYIIANFPNLFAIDVNSKFEIKPGLKDVHKLKLLKNELSGK